MNAPCHAQNLTTPISSHSLFILSAFEKLLAHIPAWLSLLLFGEGLCVTKSQTEVNNGGEVEADGAMCYSRAARAQKCHCETQKV